jgi:hypothetical protein
MQTSVKRDLICKLKSPTHTHTHTHTLTHAHTHYIYMYICIYIHTYVYTHIDMHIGINNTHPDGTFVVEAGDTLVGRINPRDLAVALGLGFRV